MLRRFRKSSDLIVIVVQLPTSIILAFMKCAIYIFSSSTSCSCSDKPAKKSKSPGGLVKKIDLVEMWISVDTDRVTDKRVSFLIGWPWNDVVVTFGSEQEMDAWLLALEEYVHITYALGQHIHRYYYFAWLARG